MGRTLKNMEESLQSAFGRVPLRFSFEVVPKKVVGLPDHVKAVSVVWEKGGKITYTDSTLVDPQDHTAGFSQVMRQSTTIYKQGNTLLAKQYTFKVQAVQPPTAPSSCSSTPSLLSQLVDSTTGNGNGSSGSRKTIARAKLDLAQFCSAQSTSSGAATEVQLPLQPQGLLVLSIKSVWLQHYDRAKAAQLLKQEPERGFGRPFGSASDLDTSTMSSMTGSAYGSCLSETDRDELHSGSAELDRLLRDAEASTAAKTVASQQLPAGASATTLAALKPSILALAVLNAGQKAQCRNPSKQSSSIGLYQGLLLQRSQSPWATARPSAAASNRSSSNAAAVRNLNQSSHALGGTAVGSTGHSNCSRRAHRRASSVPDTPTIVECADLEGPEASGSFSQTQAANSAITTTTTTAAAASTGQGEAQQHQCAPDLPRADKAQMPFGMKANSEDGAGSGCEEDEEQEDEEDTVWMDVCASATAGALQKPGPEALRSLSGRMPAWLWPSSRMAINGLTTDEIMRRISTNRDVTALQGMCRGLLCERNDWRFRATQAERTNEALQQELQRLRESEAAARQQLQVQQPEGQLLHKLVEAKVQLAQADLNIQDVKGQLERERKRHVQALAKLTSLQNNFDSYVNEQQARDKCGACRSCSHEGRVHGLGLAIRQSMSTTYIE